MRIKITLILLIVISLSIYTIYGNSIFNSSIAQEIDYSAPFDFLSSEQYSSDMDMFLDNNENSNSTTTALSHLGKGDSTSFMDNEKSSPIDNEGNPELTDGFHIDNEKVKNSLFDESELFDTKDNNLDMKTDAHLHNDEVKDLDTISDKIFQDSKINSDENKIAIVNFDDSWASQYNNAKPILDKYQFKGTFYIICDSIEGKNKLTWKQVHTLQEQGHEIGSHTMGHENLDVISAGAKTHEIVDSKKCIEEEGINVNSFSYPFNSGDDNRETLELVSNNYDFARTAGGHEGSNNFGKYYGYERYTIIGWSHDAERKENNYSDSQMFNIFTDYLYRFSDQGAKIGGIPIIIYHNIDDDIGPYNTSTDLFESEMQYLYENGFKVITMNEVFGLNGQ